METHSIFKYTTERNGIHYIHHDKIEAFKKDPLFKNDEINEKLKADMYGLSPIFIINPNKIKFYDSKNKKTNKITRRIYNGKKEDDE
jgi:hypothetical protein